MFASTSYAFLPPTTPPPAFPIYNTYDSLSDTHSDNLSLYPSTGLEDDVDLIDASSCRPYYPPSHLPATTASFDLPTHSVPSPLPLILPSLSHPQVKSTMDISASPNFNSSMREFPSRGKMDMGMAVEGTVASQAGIQTPLGQYAAQMVVWLWHGTHAQSSTPVSAKTSPLINSPNPFDSSYATSPLNPLQVSPSPEFASFVERLLKITMVSHSVTLVALLYIYRLKMRNNIQGDPGSEQRPFVVSLILGNKYLDDNTYTNKTWADLAGLRLEELNRMEAEFLKGLDFNLGVERSEYQHWRNLLDGFVYARQREAAQATQAVPRYHRPSYGHLYSPLSVVPSQLPVEAAFARARSASPCQTLSPLHPQAPQSYGYPSPSHRKRSAVDAFSAEVANTSTVYEQMRLPARKAHFASIDLTPARSDQGSPTGLARSSSLNRRIARLPGEGGRRGSMGQIFQLPTESKDLRHTAALHWQQEHEAQAQQWDERSALSAAYQRPAQSLAVPPEHLMFYQLAAEAHPGFDGAPRKAIMHYQQRPSSHYAYAPPTVTPTHYTSGYTSDDPIAHPEYPFPIPATYGYTVPQPAQFANAGPPGYAYDPSQHHPQPSSARYETGLGISGINAYGGNPAQWGEINVHTQQQNLTQSAMAPGPPEWRARSQWSSPIPVQFNPHIWQRNDQP